MMFGGIAGWPLFPYVCDRWGRKVSITFGCCCIILGVAVQSAAHSYAAFVGGRLVIGFGITFAQNASPLLLRYVIHFLNLL